MVLVYIDFVAESFICLYSGPVVSIYVRNGIAWIVFDNKSKSVNIFGEEMRKDMGTAMTVLREHMNGSIGCVVVWSQKSSFVVGADIEWMYGLHDLRYTAQMASRYQQVLLILTELPVTVVCAVNGSCLGGGMEISLYCGYRILANDPSARLGFPEVKLGIIPAGGGTTLLPRIIGLQDALKLTLTGRTITAEAAYKAGLVHEVVEYGDDPKSFFRRVDQVARGFLRKGNVWESTLVATNRKAKKTFLKKVGDGFLNKTYFGRVVIERQAIKQLHKTTKGLYPAPYILLLSILNSMATLNEPLSKTLRQEALLNAYCVCSQESKGLVSLFLNSELAKKRYRKEGVDRKWVVGVIGAGIMGSGIGGLVVSRKNRLVVKEVKQEFLERGMQSIERNVAYKKMTSEDVRGLCIGTVKWSSKAFNNVNIVIEAVLETMPIKVKVFVELEDMLRKMYGRDNKVIVCSNTSALSINRMAEKCFPNLERRKYFCGLHFFNPVSRMNLVEIIESKWTCPKVTAAVHAFVVAHGKIPIVVKKECPGFVVNRILCSYLAEAVRLVKDGMSITEVDKAILNCGMPMGPFRLMDQVGLDIAKHGSESMKQLGKRFEFDGSLAEKLLSQGANGIKAGIGFYEYETKKKGKRFATVQKRLNPHVGSLVTMFRRDRLTHHVLHSEAVERCLLMMANEAAMVFEEGIVEHAYEINLGTVLGMGFLPFHGGILSYIDYHGASDIVDRLETMNKARDTDRFTPCQLLRQMAADGTKFFPERTRLSLFAGSTNIMNERLKKLKAKIWEL